MIWIIIMSIAVGIIASGDEKTIQDKNMLWLEDIYSCKINIK